MKRLVIAAATIIAIATSCEDKKATQQRIKTIDSLNIVVESKDSLINEAFMDIDQIASSLMQIAQREKLVHQDVGNPEISKSQKDQITENISAISSQLEKNRNTIDRLHRTSKQLADANIKVDGLKKMITTLQSQIEEKDRQLGQMTKLIEQMYGEIEILHDSVSTLSTKHDNVRTERDNYRTELSTVFYIIGSEKKLRENEIIDKKGFIGRTVVEGTNHALDQFVTADRTVLERIKIGQKKIKIVTNHPANSYILVEEADGTTSELVITDKEAFWSIEKRLIISYK